MLDWYQKTPKWSTLRSLGQSRLLALTVFVPFIGAIIIFNQHIVEFLRLSPDGTIEATHAFTLTRLQLTYFGLVFLGVGSFLFGILCPIEVKKFSRVSEYIEAEKPFVTKALTSLLVTDIATDYLRNHGEKEARKRCFLNDLAYPETQKAMFDAVISQITREISDIGLESEIGNEHPLPAISALDNVITDNVAQRLESCLRVDRAFWSEFHEHSQKFLVDILYLRYESLDNSRPLFRIIISGSYVLGFSTLFYPTITTFVRILSGVTRW